MVSNDYIRFLLFYSIVNVDYEMNLCNILDLYFEK